MSRIDELNAMTGPQLIKEADKLGVKVKCDKNRTKLSEKKSGLVERILAFEAEQAEAAQIETQVSENIEAVAAAEEPKAKEIKKPNLRIKEITYKGKTQSIKAWADEINIPQPTLYDRINRNGWTVEEAIEIPLGERRKK